MALKKRGDTWHTHFFVDGERFRKSLDTTDWREAQRKERELIAEAKKGKLMASRDEFSRLPSVKQRTGSLRIGFPALPLAASRLRKSGASPSKRESAMFRFGG